MQKTMRQMIWENQITKCSSIEELFLLWEMMQREEEGSNFDTGYEEIDVGCFHLDGVIEAKSFCGVLYILKEPSLKKQLQNGDWMPVIADMRQFFREYSGGFQDERGYVAGMQNILLGNGLSPKEAIRTAAVLYLNKRGGKEVADSVYLNYANAYRECILKQIRMIQPNVIVCGGEEIFRWVIKEVFSNKKKNRSQKEYIVWKNMTNRFLFTADAEYRFTNCEEETAVTIVNMWSPAYRMNKEQYLSPEDYLQEFSKRIAEIPLNFQKKS